MGSTGDQYVSGGVNWAAFTLEQLVNMVSDKASVPQLERLADDWRDTGDGVVVAADYLGEALDDLMDFWSGRSADQARHTVALNAQWIGDLGVTAKEMGGPIEEAAGALKSAQEAMPKLPETPAQVVPGSAPSGADAATAITEGSQLGAAVGATAAGSESALETQAQQEELKLIAIETMQRFEAAALGIDQATPQFQEQSTVLRPRPDDPVIDDPGIDKWVDQVKNTTGVDARWQTLTGGLTEASGAGQRGGDFGGGFSTGGGTLGVGSGVVSGPVGGLGTIDGTQERVVGGVGGARPGGLPAAVSGVVSAAGAVGHGVTGPIGAAPMGGGMGMGGAQAGGQQHQRRVPFEGDDDDPFGTGQSASKPVIGI